MSIPAPAPTASRPTARAAWTLALLLMLAMAPALTPVAAGAGSIEPFRLHGAKIGGPFQLTDQQDRALSLGQLQGRAVLLAFGYTHCPDICPLTVSKMTAVLKTLGPQAASTRMVFISVDPERDTPKVLKAYLGFFDQRIIGLTGSLAEVQGVAALYAAGFKKVEQGSAAGYLVNHVGFFYLLDPAGKVQYIVPHTIDAETIAQGLRKVLAG